MALRKTTKDKTKNMDHVEVEGKVVDSCKGVLIVEDKAGNRIKTRLSGKMRMNKIMVLVGDKVQVKVSPYDLENGFIVRRLSAG